MTTWGSGTVRTAARVFGGPTTIRPSTSGAPGGHTAAVEVHVTDAQADQFGPSQARVRQDRDDVSLIAAGGR